MATREIEQDRWEDYFNHFSAVMGAELVEIEVAGLDVGDQVAAEWMPLSGISYDPKDDILVVDAGEVLRHTIRRPRKVYIEEDDNGIHSMDIECAQGHRHILRFKTPMALPEAD